MKYIVVETKNATGGTQETPIIFSDLVSHDEVARKFFKPISAGFLSINKEMGECKEEYRVSAYGKSVSLGVSSRTEDKALIERHLNFEN